ncbi:MAG: hypothetical protein EZS28_049151, partial [Streblomastix strix]
SAVVHKYSHLMAIFLVFFVQQRFRVANFEKNPFSLMDVKAQRLLFPSFVIFLGNIPNKKGK